MHYPTPIKKIHVELNATDNEFSKQFSRIWLFLRIKVAISNIGLNSIAC